MADADHLERESTLSIGQAEFQRLQVCKVEGSTMHSRRSNMYILLRKSLIWVHNYSNHTIQWDTQPLRVPNKLVMVDIYSTCGSWLHTSKPKLCLQYKCKEEVEG